MPDGSSSSVVACLVVTTSGRILLLWDQDDTLPFRYPQLAMLLASLFHFSQAQSFGHLELRNGFTVLVSSDVAAQISVAVICATPPTTSSRPDSDFPTEVLPLQLARLKSLIILQEFARCYRADIERLAAEGLEQAKLKAEEYTLTSALGGFDGCEGTLDEFVAFQNDFVGLVMEISARGIQNSLLSWGHVAADGFSTLALARGFLMNAETGDSVYSTPPGPDGSFFSQDAASRRLHHLHKSARVQQSIKRVAKALHECAPALIQIADAAAVVVRFNYLSGSELSELFVALRVLSTGVFVSGVVFHGDNALFRGRESELRTSGRLQQALAANSGGRRMRSLLRDPSVDIELHVGGDGAASEVWQAMDRLVQPLTLKWSASTDTVVTKPVDVQIPESTNEEVLHTKDSGSPRLPQQTQ